MDSPTHLSYPVFSLMFWDIFYSLRKDFYRIALLFSLSLSSKIQIWSAHGRLIYQPYSCTSQYLQSCNFLITNITQNTKINNHVHLNVCHIIKYYKMILLSLPDSVNVTAVEHKKLKLITNSNIQLICNGKHQNISTCSFSK